MVTGLGFKNDSVTAARDLLGLPTPVHTVEEGPRTWTLNITKAMVPLGHWEQGLFRVV